MFTGCTDNGLAFSSLARAKGIPTVFIQTARIDWIDDLVKNSPDANSIRGHILVEVCLNDGKWYLIDSTTGKMFLDYDRNNMSLSDDYYVFAKSIEVWDTGVKNLVENNANMKNIFRNFDVSKYVNPKYNYIDLMTGETKQGTDSTGGSLVIGNAAALLGPQKPVEAFYDKYFKDMKCLLSSETRIEEKELTTADTLADFHIKGSNAPAFLKKYLPDIDSLESGRIYKYIVEGQKRILFIGDSEDALLKIVQELPDDFLE